jgi:5-methylcytosine-specific restriction endonuclease McrA
MDAAAVRFVRQRAAERCEYCGLPQKFSGLRFHIEHIVARQHGGSDESSNLALACPECNLRKETNLTVLTLIRPGDPALSSASVSLG